MTQKSLDQLRKLTRARKLRGYSKLPKSELIELLKKHKARSSDGASVARMAGKKSTKAKMRAVSVHPAKTATKKNQPRAKAAPAPDSPMEERIESAKFAMAPAGTAQPSQPIIADLRENIERLAALNEPTLCLLPQKPGVVHAYWVLQNGANIGALRLRLCYADAHAIELLEEIKLPSERGYWYFHVAERFEPGNFLAHLGYYDDAGKFATAISRGIARIPSGVASGQVDRSWWISDREFREMYLRAGGVTRAASLRWPGTSPSSR